MRKLLNNWLSYGLGEEDYKKSMEIVFSKNISGLLKTNSLVAVLLGIFTFFPLFLDKNSIKSLFFIISSSVSLILYIFIRCKYSQKNQNMKLNKSLIYTLLFLTYANVISFGIYLGVWANPGKIAGSFFGILICALFLFNIPAIFHLCLTMCSMLVFIIIVILNKPAVDRFIDIPNAIVAGIIGLIFGWHIIMNRLSLAAIAAKMENERNNYFDQCTVDELTQLKNRRDFINSFQRFLASPRQSDNYMCVAILDIDFFKKYNDYYGHPEGDECLRKIGKALNDIHNSQNIYAARIGGEEFALIWFENKAANVHNIASLINKTIYNLKILHEKSITAPYVTVSIGIHVVRCDASNDLNTLYHSADKALYRAKKNGRNCVYISLSDSLRITPIRKIA
jgi:diguanylate cyclase (GGDEF)-like protein